MDDESQPLTPKTKVERQLLGESFGVDRDLIYRFFEERNSFSTGEIVNDACDAYGLLFSCEKADPDSPAMDLVQPAAFHAAQMMAKAFLKALDLEDTDLEFELSYEAETIEEAAVLIKEELRKRAC